MIIPVSNKKKILNYLTKKGKKELGEKLLNNSIKLIQKDLIKNHVTIIKTAILNNAPVIQIKQLKRKRKKLREFPFIISKKTRIFLALKSIINSYNKKLSNKFENVVSQNFIKSVKLISESIKTKKAIQESSLNLKKYVHYRWLF